MVKRVTVLYDRIEDDVFEAARAAKRATSELVPVHVPLGKALEARGFEVRKLAVAGDLAALVTELSRARPEIVFNICDGVLGVTKLAGKVAGILELLGLPFTGSGSIAMALAGDKVIAKRVFESLGIATPRWAVVPRGTKPDVRGLSWPLIVKPKDEDASVGITEKSVVRDARALAEMVAFVHEEIETDALVEEFIVGREIYATVLGNADASVLPLLEWPLRGGEGIGSWDAKWRPKHKDYMRCANIFAQGVPEATADRIRRDTLLAYRALQLTDYGRVDIRVAPDGTPYFLELNPNPFFDENAEVAQACRAVGLEYPALAERVVELALARAEAERSLARAA